MITGISGTVGTAFAELLHKDHDLFGVDRNETSVSQFIQKYPYIPVWVNEFSDIDLDGIELVIHLAAMKHIDFCEQNPNNCVLNNVLKTHLLFKNAHLTGADILFMSTDKAVEPNSVYGYSKALGEAMCKEYGGAFVRSGNIVASNGSVFGIWEEAIKELKPIKITDKEMHRYFISPENLVKRVWGAYENGEREIIPEMDEDIMLIDLAARILSKHGYTLEDYPGGIEFIGLRDGEKLKEKLRW